ncbi:MAG: right-handed parallel beta-helix repeat-containing protein [Planctomycetota bacterium]|jgi:hypothetical protein
MRFVLPALLLLGFSIAHADTISGDPTNYKSKISSLAPGDVLELAPGTYNDGFHLDGVNGTSANWITIRSQDPDDPAVIMGRSCCNTVELVDCSYLAVEDLKIDGQDVRGIHAVSAKNGSSNNTHNIRIEGCTIVGHGASQQVVGISTKCPTWGWIIRGNRIYGAGTGIYLGNSNGEEPFVAGIIENNLIVDPEGYCMQIKHQNDRPTGLGLPTTPQVTIIRHNVFIKTDRASGDGARPNLLLGGFPDSGDGASDLYEVYGNFFFHNTKESLLQAEGRVSVHDNVFVDCPNDSALLLTDHNKTVELAHVYNNTFYDVERPVNLADTANEGSIVVGNVSFAPEGFVGNWDTEQDNLELSVADAPDYVKNPSKVLGSMDFYPIAGQLEGTALDLSAFAGNIEFDLDFNGNAKGGNTFRGAYAGDGDNPGWQLDEALKGAVGAPPPPPNDTTPPTGTVGAPASTSSTTIDLVLSADDSEGAVARMRFSNDGSTWSPDEAYRTAKTGWDLAAYGGDNKPGTKTVYAQFRDNSGNWSSVQISAQVELTEGGPDPDPSPAPSTGALGFESILLLAGAMLTLWRKSRPSHS